MRSRFIEIHDSILAGISFLKADAQLHFSSVYIHQNDGVRGLDVSTGWVQEAILRIRDAHVDGAFLQFPVDLSNGQTHIGDIILRNEIPIPLHHEGAFTLRLKAMWQETGVVTFTGSGAELELLGEPRYVEEGPGRAQR
jgi:hypothetical protein